MVAALACSASRAVAATLTKGTIELTPSTTFARASFSFSGADAGTLTLLSTTTEIGYCVTDHFEQGGGLLVDYESIDLPGQSSESATSLGLIAGVVYNFASGGQTIPFARGGGVPEQLGALSAGEETTVIAPALEVGLRYLVGSS
ncbi:MAG: hypothetical protein ACRENJ_06150, partial [Candidatus Eiseniibacteriota bacterium]